MINDEDIIGVDDGIATKTIKVNSLLQEQGGETDGCTESDIDEILNNIPRESYVPISERPGAYFVPSEDYLQVRRENFPDEENVVTVPVVNNNNGSVPLVTDTVVDGIIVTPPTETKRNRLFDTLLVIITMSVIALIVFFTVGPDTTRRDESIDNLENPSSPPSTALFQSLPHESYVKELVISISGKELLDDPNSLQHISLKRTAFQLDFLINEGILQLNDTQEIIDRYLLTVIMLSASHQYATERKHQPSSRFIIDHCKLLTCNEKREVTVLYFRNNKLTNMGGGTIAKEIGYLSGLTHFIYKNSALEGPIPTEIGMLENLHTLDIGSNSLTGPIPTEIFSMQSLQWIFLNNNKLSGTIPPAIGNMTSLFHADFSQNMLTGSVPCELNILDNLHGFHLQENNLSESMENLCNHEFSQDNVNKTELIGSSELFENVYRYSGNAGYSIDCSVPLVNCSCCDRR